MVPGFWCVRSLIVVRCCRIVIVRCKLSSPFSPVVFLRYWFASFGVHCTLFALHCSHFDDDSMLLAIPFLLPAVGYWLFTSRCSVFVSRCLVLVSRYSSACCLLRILTVPCSLFLTRYSRSNCCFCLLASCRPLIAARPRELFIPLCGVLFAFHDKNLVLTDARRSL